MLESPPFKSVLGTTLAAVNYHQAVDWILETASTTTKAHAVAAANTHVVTLARHDLSYRKTLDQFSLIVPDGMPLVWSMNRQNAGLTDRVYGPTLMKETLNASQNKEGVSHFLLGSTPEILQALEKNLRRDFPNLSLKGSYSPPFSPDGSFSEAEQKIIRQKIAESGANIIWVALGCPKQERWIASQLSELPPGVYLGIGAAFAMHAGMLTQAPAKIQKLGIEWLWRMCMEPRRLMKRYLKWNTLFIWYSLKDSFFSR